jgi:hypothetical protein
VAGIYIAVRFNDLLKRITLINHSLEFTCFNQITDKKQVFQVFFGIQAGNRDEFAAWREPGSFCRIPPGPR